MLHVCIVDDNPNDREVLIKHFEKFQKETDEVFKLTVFTDGLHFISDYDGTYDLIIFDVEMPHMDGMEAAHRLRAKDSSVGIIFVTNMAQYAIKGYEVDAIDFMIKPVGYYNFIDKLKKAIRFIKRDLDKEILLNHSEGVDKLPLSKILYVEKDKNYLVYHTDGNEYKVRGTMKDAEAELLESGFAKNISGCIVNLRHVQKITGDTLYIDDKTLPISRGQRKQFVNAYMSYLGGRL